MEHKKGKFAQIWEATGHIHLVSWLIEFAKIVLGPAVAGWALWSGIHEVPTTYLIAATAVALGATTYVVSQFAALYERNRTGFAFALAYEGVHMGFDRGNDAGMLQIGIRLRNVAAQPVLYKVKRFDVVIGSRTIAKPIFMNDGGLIPRATSRTYTYPAFPRADIEEFLGKHADGSIALEIEYGHPETRPVRRLKMKIDIGLNLGAPAGASDIITEEVDSRL